MAAPNGRSGELAAARPTLKRRLYDWLMRLAAGRYGLLALGIVSFTESSFFPIPGDVLLVPMVLRNPGNAWRIASVCTAASVAGGLAGYAIGYYAYATLGHAIIEIYGYERGFAAFRAAYHDWGLWIILIKGLTPIPYKLVTIASGVAKFDIAVFVTASVATRGARFFVIAALLRFYGAPIQAAIEKHLGWVTLGFAGFIAGGIVDAQHHGVHWRV